MSVGIRLKELRVHREVTLSDIHREKGLATGHLSRVEHGAQVPSPENVRALADLLGASSEEADELIRERNLDLFSRKVRDAYSLLDEDQRQAFLQDPMSFLRERQADTTQDTAHTPAAADQR